MKSVCFKYIFFIVAALPSMLFPSPAFSQNANEIPIGTWRAHLSYNKIISIAIGDDGVYAASQMGVLKLNKADNMLETLNKLNGLSSSGISHLAYDNDGQQLLISYQNGNLDIVKDNTVLNFPRLRDLTTVAGSKRINHAHIRSQLAYLSTDYGIVVFDMQQKEIKETWRDLGREGKDIEIIQTAFFQDSIVAATSKGLMIGSLNDNLLDYNNWKRFDTGELAGKVTSVASFNGSIYASVKENGLFRYDHAAFVKENFLQGASINALEASADNLLMVAHDKLWMLNQGGQLIQVADDEIAMPLIAKEDQEHTLWIGDAINGLISNLAGGFNSYIPNGPSTEAVSRLKYYDGKIFAVKGYPALGEPMATIGVIDYFEEGVWKTKPTTLINVTDIEFSSGKTYTASFGDGLLQEDPNGSILFDESNSPLENVSDTSKAVLISSLKNSDEGLWVANYGAVQSLHLLKPDNTWQSFSISFGAGRYPLQMTTDFSGKVWMAANPAQGGGIVVFNPENGQSKWINGVAGNGGLSNTAVHSLATDRDGNVWVGTEAGVAYFYSDNEDALYPIFENRFLLKDEIITAIEVDGGNRKWVGTNRGLWLFNPSGETLVHSFTEENSPLLSDKINDIEINDVTGEVFIATANGIVSFRADATASENSFNNIKIFPNPVTSDFSGVVGITGLATDAFVKITDTSGRLIWEVQAQGGTATWNIRDYKGRRARTGVYLVFAASADGNESIVGKIAVIE